MGVAELVPNYEELNFAVVCSYGRALVNCFGGFGFVDFGNTFVDCWKIILNRSEIREIENLAEEELFQRTVRSRLFVFGQATGGGL